MEAQDKMDSIFIIFKLGKYKLKDKELDLFGLQKA